MDDKSIRSLIRFWAKTTSVPHDPAHQNAYHPLLCHMFDVACVAEVMWRDVLPAAARRRMTEALGLDPESEPSRIAVGKLISFVAGLHDLGKCSPPFALRGHGEGGRATAHLLELYRGGPYWLDSVPPARDVPHGYVTAMELPALLRSFGTNKEIANQIGILIGGHHGIFPEPDWRPDGRKATPANIGNIGWLEARSFSPHRWR